MNAVTLERDQDNTGHDAVFIGCSIRIQFSYRNLVNFFLGVVGVSGAFRDEVGKSLSFDGCSRMEGYVELTQFNGPF